MEVKLEEIVGNENSRVPISQELASEGYGVFEAVEPLKPLWEMATSDSKSERDHFVQLIDRFDENLKSLANNILLRGQLQPVRLAKNGKGYNVVFGMRRCLATAYNACKSNTKDPVINADVGKAAYEDSIAENFLRKQPSPIETAKSYHALLQKQGWDRKRIAKTMGVTVATVGNYLKLLKLPEGMQKRVEDGTLKMSTALEANSVDQDGEPKKKPRPTKKMIEERIEEAKALVKDGQEAPKGYDIDTLRWCLGKFK